jgi:hypothetical protein
MRRRSLRGASLAWALLPVLVIVCHHGKDVVMMGANFYRPLFLDDAIDIFSACRFFFCFFSVARRFL